MKKNISELVPVQLRSQLVPLIDHLIERSHFQNLLGDYDLLFLLDSNARLLPLTGCVGVTLLKSSQIAFVLELESLCSNNELFASFNPATGRIENVSTNFYQNFLSHLELD